MARASARSRSKRGGGRVARDVEIESDDAAGAAGPGSELLGLVLVTFSLLATLALATYSPADPLLSLEVRNGAGPVGATVAGALMGGFGAGSFVLVAGTAFLGARLLMSLGLPGLFSRFWLGMLALVPSAAALPILLFGLEPGELPWIEPGWLGTEWSRLQTLLFGGAGAVILTMLLFVVGVLSLTGVSASATLGVIGSAGAWTLDRILWAADEVVPLVDRVLEALGSGLSALREALVHEGERARESVNGLLVRRAQKERRARVEERRGPDPSSDDLEDEESVDPVSVLEEEDEEDADEEREAGEEAGPRSARPMRKLRAQEEPDIVDHDEQRRKKRKPEQEAFRFNDDGHKGPFKLPDISIFSATPEGERSYDRESLIMNSKILEKKLADFGVQGRVVRVHPGPVITMYEYEPAPGIKVNRIVGLTDDLTMALRAISIRIIAPLPGKSVVGIEVPNPRRETVYLREILDSESFRKSRGVLTVAMGKDIFGNSVTSDLAKMPHLLVAGSTGTGKSVFLNAFLCSLLCRATPNQLKLLMIDPKMLELSIYDGIPHLIADVVTSPKRAAAALQGVVRKMEERYQMMSATGVRNIDQFNEKARKCLAAGEETFQLKPRPGQTEGDEIEWQELPYIVVVIDELADLMMSSAKEVEESLQRLAQMARASGIHLVLATQRPSVDVLTGVIKANFPARVSFQVSSGTDSRTILDQKGADDLLGMGDMLFLPPGSAVLQRIHGPFVTETEVHDLVAFLKGQGRPVFDEDLVKADSEAERVESRGEEVDDMFDQAVSIVAETRNASISYVQRRLKIGYNRAARIIEQMEQDGMIGPQIGAKGREVYLPAPDRGED
ncbi:MAG: DNA translocase FtsK 4TM domain-containing protein [Myxococcota bacterium]